jgi:hypothetical protein
MAKITFVSPVGTARYPHITTPDNTGQYADGKFKTKLVVPKADAAPLVEHLKALAKEHKVAKLPFTEEDGDVVFSIKSKFKPLVFDAKNHEVKKVDLRVGGGSKLRVAGIVYPYEKGLSLQMKQVQVLELQDGSDAMFEAAEGSFDASDFAGDEGNSAFTASNDLDI